MTDSPVSLHEFAATHPPKGKRCLLCSVDTDIERQAREGKAAGVTYHVLAQWLESIVGEKVTKGRLERHFQQEHKR